MKNATQNAAATRNTTAKAVIKQTTDGSAPSPNAAHAKSKTSKRKAVVAKVNAKAIATKPKAQVQTVHVEIPAALKEQAALAVLRYKRIKATQGKHLEEMKGFGNILLDIRKLYPSDQQFGTAVQSETDFGSISRQERHTMMKLAEFWTGIHKAIKDGKMAESTSAEMLVRNYVKLLKASGQTDKVGRNAAKAASKQGKTAKAVKQPAAKSAKAETTVVIPTVKFDEQSVADALFTMISKHKLDADLIFDKLYDIIDSAKAAKH